MRRVRAGRRAVTAASVLMLVGSSSGALAATGSGLLVDDPEAADLVRVSCFDDGNGTPVSLVATIRNDLPVAAPLLSAQIATAGAATNTTDPVDGDGQPSAPVFVDGGAGEYDVFVDKSGAGAVAYTLSVQCMTGSGGSGVATGTFVAGWALPVPLAGSWTQLLLVAALAAVGISMGSAARRIGRRTCA